MLVLREGGLDGGEIVVVAEVVGDGLRVAVEDFYRLARSGLAEDGGVVAIFTYEAGEGAWCRVVPVEYLAAREGRGEIEGVRKLEERRVNSGGGLATGDGVSSRGGYLVEGVFVETSEVYAGNFTEEEAGGGVLVSGVGIDLEDRDEDIIHGMDGTDVAGVGLIDFA
ncbi:hypothetical protein OAF27_03060, partial [Verrucomicrobiales bacterium]|nr:hypothetical protein [Verrucomicrobiales bacterium]